MNALKARASKDTRPILVKASLLVLDYSGNYRNSILLSSSFTLLSVLSLLLSFSFSLLLSPSLSLSVCIFFYFSPFIDLNTFVPFHPPPPPPLGLLVHASGLFALIAMGMAQLLQVSASAIMQKKNLSNALSSDDERRPLIATSVDGILPPSDDVLALPSSSARYSYTSLEQGAHNAPNVIVVESSHPKMILQGGQRAARARGKEDSGRAHSHSDYPEEHSDHGHALLFNDTIEKHVSTYILELGIASHSVIIGLTLGTATTEFHSLLAALVFHQFFEGISLATVVTESRFKLLTSALMVLFYSLTTPIGVALGIAIHKTYNEHSTTNLIITGVLDSVSAGILIFDSLVNIITPHMNSPTYRNASFSSCALQIACMWLGGSIMAMLGKWA